MRKIELTTFGIVFVTLLAAIPTNANNVKSVKEAAEIAEKELLLKEGIVGISYTDNKPYKVIVYIESEEYRSIVPDEIAGFKTEIRVSGRIKAIGLVEPKSIVIPQMLGWKRRIHWDPTVGGISVGTNYITAGTLGVCIGGFILSCAHVIAYDMNANPLQIGTSVIQPGLSDGGGPVIGYLYDYIPIRFGLLSLIFPNHADAAIANLCHSAKTNAVLGPDDTNTYSISMTAKVPWVGQTVRKSGRTTAVTYNTVKDRHAAIKVWYDSKWARFKDVIVVEEPFIEPGDSGSFVDLNGNFVGLVFAGSPYYAYVCKASYIKSAFGI